MLPSGFIDQIPRSCFWLYFILHNQSIRAFFFSWFLQNKFKIQPLLLSLKLLPCWSKRLSSLGTLLIVLSVFFLCNLWFTLKREIQVILETKRDNCVTEKCGRRQLVGKENLEIGAIRLVEGFWFSLWLRWKVEVLWLSSYIS